ncbi:MAG: transposase [Bdellovibrionota bacterium]
MQKQQKFDFAKVHWKYRFSHGGTLRNSRKGRGTRPLSKKESLHLVFKANKDCLRGGLRTYRRYFLIQKIVDRYAQKFFVKIEQISIQNDHVHFLIRASRRTDYQNFFRVVTGQIAQQFQKSGLLNFALDLHQKKKVTDTPVDITETRKKQKKLWKHRPFTRVICGWKAYKTVVSYVKLNEQEALGNIPYRKLRLKGLSSGEWEILWA